jgi:hypothetical protein
MRKFTGLQVKWTWLIAMESTAKAHYCTYVWHAHVHVHLHLPSHVYHVPKHIKNGGCESIIGWQRQRRRENWSRDMPTTLFTLWALAGSPGWLPFCLESVLIPTLSHRQRLAMKMFYCVWTQNIWMLSTITLNNFLARWLTVVANLNLKYRQHLANKSVHSTSWNILWQNSLWFSESNKTIMWFLLNFLILNNKQRELNRMKDIKSCGMPVCSGCLCNVTHRS